MINPKKVEVQQYSILVCERKRSFLRSRLFPVSKLITKQHHQLNGENLKIV